MEESIKDYRLADMFEEGEWRLDKLRSIEFWVQQIINHPPIRPQLERSTRWCWMESVGEIPKPREVYLHLTRIPPSPIAWIWKRILKLPVYPKVQMFLWQLWRDRLPARVLFDSFGLHMDILCLLCRMEMETSAHLFTRCQFAAEYWMKASVRILPSQSIWLAGSWVEDFADSTWINNKKSEEKLVTNINGSNVVIDASDASVQLGSSEAEADFVILRINPLQVLGADASNVINLLDSGAAGPIHLGSCGENPKYDIAGSAISVFESIARGCMGPEELARFARSSKSNGVTSRGKTTLHHRFSLPHLRECVPQVIGRKHHSCPSYSRTDEPPYAQRLCISSTPLAHGNLCANDWSRDN
ncbi:hypothetical protein QJS10_CPA05g01729 [Acorus calamus]|uniref:Reverse transcriptase zinc-binding domain-containing protein n=1 Tax=Acorus calamus TaxID=4465 RepID=A0AAV9EUQ1_ACOCL|nr:hypothetical protein QJS10_CPA05g01729 [Acorus calamus]